MHEIDKPLLITAAKAISSDNRIKRFENVATTAESYEKSCHTEAIEVIAFDGARVKTKLYKGDNVVLQFHQYGALKFLELLNRDEFEKTTEMILYLNSQIHELLEKLFVRDNNNIYLLNEKVMYYQSFHKDFIVWFENKKLVAPQIPPSALMKVNIPNEFRLKDSKKKGIDGLEWNILTKQRRVEIFADRARADTENTPDYWWNIFKAEFPEGYSTELNRYRNMFKKENRSENFRKNGLTFYNKSNTNPK
jgi:hypothetical protein